MKLKARDFAIALVLVVGVLGAAMATNSPSNVALAATTCGINGCVSTPPLSSSTSYTYTSPTSTSITSTTSTSTTSTSISSSTTATTATTTSTFFSYTSTISTTITTTSYSTIYTFTQISQGTNIITIPTITTTGSTYTNLVTQKGTSITSCPVSYVTNGNRLQPYAAFLRTFRDKIQNTTAGSSFMATFNSWYYSWAPSVAYSTSANPWAYRAVQVTVIPLIGILYASYYTYALTAPFSAEAGAIMAGVVAAALIGLVYLAPVAYLTTRIIRKRFTITRLTLSPSVAWFAASIALCGIAYATTSQSILAAGTSSLVLSTLSLASLFGTRALAYVQLPITNYANITLLLKRFTRTFP